MAFVKYVIKSITVTKTDGVVSGVEYIADIADDRLAEPREKMGILNAEEIEKINKGEATYNDMILMHLSWNWTEIDKELDTSVPVVDTVVYEGKEDVENLIPSDTIT